MYVCVLRRCVNRRGACRAQTPGLDAQVGRGAAAGWQRLSSRSIGVERCSSEAGRAELTQARRGIHIALHSHGRVPPAAATLLTDLQNVPYANQSLIALTWARTCDVIVGVASASFILSYWMSSQATVLPQASFKEHLEFSTIRHAGLPSVCLSVSLLVSLSHPLVLQLQCTVHCFNTVSLLGGLACLSSCWQTCLCVQIMNSNRVGHW